MAAPTNCFTASHAVLFETDDDRCSVCSEILSKESDDDAGPGLLPTKTWGPSRGRGLLVWSRGDERRFEEPELCPHCASAIGVTALHRWEIEEEEG